MGRYSIIIEDKNIYHALICRVVNIIKDKDLYNGRFTIKQLTSLEIFSLEEEDYLKKIFSPDIDELDIWGEHYFYFIKNAWEYSEYIFYDYRKVIRMMMLLLNKSKIPLCTKVRTDDYHLISKLWHMKILWESAALDADWENRECSVNYAVIELLSHNLKDRLGDSCRFDFRFIKAFMEARTDYFRKKVNDAIMGIESINN